MGLKIFNQQKKLKQTIYSTNECTCIYSYLSFACVSVYSNIILYTVLFFSDGANGASSTATSSTAQGGLFGPNIVMGAFSMPVDVVGATQVTKQVYYNLYLIHI